MSDLRSISWSLLGREPFRVMFPLATAAGLAGVSLWPLYFGGVVSFYPGLSHARLMAYGFFGGFIIGFLGTALPRMLSAQPLSLGSTAVLVALYLPMIAALLLEKIAAGDALFLALLVAFGTILALKVKSRQDVPPPSFVLVALALISAAAGAVLSMIVNSSEDAFFCAALQHLLAFQGFVLLPILGVGPFLLPRFFGLPTRHDFPESRDPPPGWSAAAGAALIAGLLIMGSFWAEAAGWVRLGPAVRLLVSLVYLAREVPLHRSAGGANTFAWALRVAILLMLAGFLTIVLWPAYRVSLLHLTLIGGFAAITLTVATRVVFGHSGNGGCLDRPSWWFRIATGLMLLAMVTRISGDFWPKVLATHYSYGGLVWIAGVVLWSVYVLPKVLVADPE